MSIEPQSLDTILLWKSISGILTAEMHKHSVINACLVSSCLAEKMLKKARTKCVTVCGYMAIGNFHFRHVWNEIDGHVCDVDTNHLKHLVTPIYSYDQPTNSDRIDTDSTEFNLTEWVIKRSSKVVKRENILSGDFENVRMITKVSVPINAAVKQNRKVWGDIVQSLRAQKLID